TIKVGINGFGRIGRNFFRERGVVGEIVHTDDLDVRLLLESGAQEVAADAAESVDSNLDGQGFLLDSQGCLRNSGTDMARTPSYARTAPDVTDGRDDLINDPDPGTAEAAPRPLRGRSRRCRAPPRACPRWPEGVGSGPRRHPSSAADPRGGRAPRGSPGGARGGAGRQLAGARAPRRRGSRARAAPAARRPRLPGRSGAGSRRRSSPAGGPWPSPRAWCAAPPRSSPSRAPPCGPGASRSRPRRAAPPGRCRGPRGPWRRPPGGGRRPPSRA